MADTRRANTTNGARKRASTPSKTKATKSGAASGAAPCPESFDDEIPSFSDEQIREVLKKSQERRELTRRVVEARESFSSLRDEVFVKEIVELVRARARKTRGLVPPPELRDDSDKPEYLRGKGSENVMFRHAPKNTHEKRRSEEPGVHWIDPKDEAIAEGTWAAIETLLLHAVGCADHKQQNLALDLLKIQQGATVRTNDEGEDPERIRAASVLIERAFSAPFLPGEADESREKRITSDLAYGLSSLGPYPPELGAVDLTAIARECIAGRNQASRCLPWALKAVPDRTGELPVEWRDQKGLEKKIRKALPTAKGRKR